GRAHVVGNIPVVGACRAPVVRFKRFERAVEFVIEFVVERARNRRLRPFAASCVPTARNDCRRPFRFVGNVARRRFHLLHDAVLHVGYSRHDGYDDPAYEVRNAPALVVGFRENSAAGKCSGVFRAPVAGGSRIGQLAAKSSDHRGLNCGHQ
ncbi:MAG: hypothetical protein BJ554DRAFT_5577, partial [Olpidium bornovanus]